LLSGHIAVQLGRNSAYLFSQVHSLRADTLPAVRDMLYGNLEVLLGVMAPLVAALFVAACAANVAQVGLKITPLAMAPQLERLNPITGMKRFFQKRVLFDLFKNSLKIGLFALLAYATIGALIGRFTAAPLLPLPEIIGIGRSGFAMLMAVLLALTALLAILDWFWQRYQHEQNLKMSRYEVKQEMKDLEGDPQIKARIKGMQIEQARKRMLADIPTADVVLTNPTRLAVALRYDQGDVAPLVVAKGAGHLAETIRRIARTARVPVIENKPIARALYRQVEVGRIIPESLFQVVAEILAYVYRLKKA
jgi:flagellar biosynthetic protein FlhB